MSKTENSIIYITLNDGDILQENDEYCRGSNLWRKIPSFMVGDKVGKDLTQWRRPDNSKG
jgi:hypothetical protein